MANIKRITMDYSINGLTVYCIVRRESDSFMLDDVDGSFAAAPTDYFMSMPEDGAIAGKYEVSETRQVWSNGLYSICIYNQTGASPFPAVDSMIGDGEIVIQDDIEITTFLSSLPWSGTTTVEQIFDQVIGRINAAPGFTIFEAINKITNLIFKQLWYLKSDLACSDVSILFATGNQAMSVPATFMGLKSKPFIQGVGELSPIISGTEYSYYGKTGTPDRYKLQQGMLHVFPTPAKPTVIKCPYFRFPGEVSAMSDVVPYTGQFKQLFMEGIVKISSQGMAFVEDQSFAAFINDEINKIIPIRSNPVLPARRSASYF
jgi:hypothetical protein